MLMRSAVAVLRYRAAVLCLRFYCAARSGPNPTTRCDERRMRVRRACQRVLRCRARYASVALALRARAPRVLMLQAQH